MLKKHSWGDSQVLRQAGSVHVQPPIPTEPATAGNVHFLNWCKCKFSFVLSLVKTTYSSFKCLWTGMLCKRCFPVFQVVKAGHWLGKLEEEWLNVKKIQFFIKQCDKMKTWPCLAVFHFSIKILKFALHEGIVSWKVSRTNYMAKKDEL